MPPHFLFKSGKSNGNLTWRNQTRSCSDLKRNSLIFIGREILSNKSCRGKWNAHFLPCANSPWNLWTELRLQFQTSRSCGAMFSFSCRQVPQSTAIYPENYAPHTVTYLHCQLPRPPDHAEHWAAVCGLPQYIAYGDRRRRKGLACVTQDVHLRVGRTATGGQYDGRAISITVREYALDRGIRYEAHDNANYGLQQLSIRRNSQEIHHYRVHKISLLVLTWARWIQPAIWYQFL